jgi:hypothetical protein
MKYAFALLVLIHALIHLMGFAKAFHYAALNTITGTIAKPAGLLWLLVTLLYATASMGFLLDKPFWPILAITATLLSQVLIILVWKDAKFGTLANVIILLVAIPAYAQYRFTSMVREESLQLLKSVTPIDKTINSTDLEKLPPIMRQWLANSGITGKPMAYCARIKQNGKMRTSADGKWMSFTAEQYFDFQQASFVWTTTVEMMPLLYMDGRDKFQNGRGEMLIKLLSLIPVVDEANNSKINTGTMLRYMGETTWFPSTALSPYMTWEEIDAYTVKGTMQHGDTRAEGLYHFSETGDFVSFEAERFYGGGEDARLEKWLVTVDEYTVINGMRIPVKNSVTWKLKEGDFTWLTLEITDLELNKPEVY